MGFYDSRGGPRNSCLQVMGEDILPLCPWIDRLGFDISMDFECRNFDCPRNLDSFLSNAVTKGSCSTNIHNRALSFSSVLLEKFLNSYPHPHLRSFEQSKMLYIPCMPHVCDIAVRTQLFLAPV